MMKQLSYGALVLLITLAACNRDDDGTTTPTPTVPTCRITAVDEVGDGDSSRYALTYNSDGKLASVNYGEDVTTFTYAGNTVYATTTGSGIAHTDTITLNGDGLVTQVRASYASGSIVNRTVADYVYNGTEVQRAVRTHYFTGNMTMDTTFYTWIGGNCISESSGGFQSTYEFYTDKAAPASGGDPLAFFDITATSAPVVRNKNLTKTFTSDGVTVNIAYEYDAEGKVTRASANSLFGNGYFRYTYSCQ